MTTIRQIAAGRARGSIAVECALILPILLLLMSAVLMFGRVFWHYTVAEKAAHDAARFLASAPVTEMRAGAGGGEVAIVGVARQIMQDEIGELNPGTYIAPNVQCDTGAVTPKFLACAGVDTPKSVLVNFEIPVTDPFFAPFLASITKNDPIKLSITVGFDYVGH